MPRMSGLDLLKALKGDVEHIKVILLTAQGTVDTAVEAVKAGAEDYLTKPLDTHKLQRLLERLAELNQQKRENQALRRQLTERGRFGRIIGHSPRCARSTRSSSRPRPRRPRCSSLGESGTGKELVAQTIHQLSPRAAAPFVALNCAAIPDTLLESEIFGHEKGAFTGATERRAGCFELADRGTLFLDEIAEMTPATQVKLLRVLQERKFRRLGGRVEQDVDVRVIAATNIDPVGGDPRGQAPRGPVLPPERLHRRPAAAARAQGRPAAAHPGLHRGIQRARQPFGEERGPGGHAAARTNTTGRATCASCAT